MPSDASGDSRGPFVPALRAVTSGHRNAGAALGGPAPQYRFFGGKGGTGKTTCAAAAAIALAEEGRRLLVVSTDPAHSLGDVLAGTLTARPSKISTRHGLLNACELDADRALARWLTERRPALATIFERGTILDRGDIDSFLNLSLPGVDELIGLLEIERLAEGDAYDEVVVDTAPTGHTLRLLGTPAMFDNFARVLDLIQEKDRVLAAAFGHGTAQENSEALIEELRRDGERLGALLRDRSRMRLCWVVLPEKMSVAESRRAMATLRADGIHASDIIVNRLTPPPPSACTLCDGRRRAEAESLNAILAQWGAAEIGLWTLTGREAPPRGIAALRAFARSVAPLEKPVMGRRAERTRPAQAAAPRRALPAPVRPSPSTRLLIVGGKGGVGKTSCAATLALAVARDAPDRRILLVSTDPAHSIGDVLGQAIGDVERPVRGTHGNLVAREIDAARGWGEWRERYRASIKHFFETLRTESSADFAVDRAIIEELFELAPPGMDEIVAMLTIIEALVPSRPAAGPGDATRTAALFDLVIIDSAPTGHTRRLLALPAQAHAWVRQLMTVMLKYKMIAGFEPLANELLWLSRGFDELQQLLADSRRCGFIVVTRPEQLPALETIRLIEWLGQNRIAMRALIVNGITPPGCARCRRVMARERQEIETLTSHPAWKRGRRTVILTDAIAPPPRGVAALSDWQRTWRPERVRAPAIRPRSFP